jgi:hypothetical protein
MPGGVNIDLENRVQDVMLADFCNGAYLLAERKPKLTDVLWVQGSSTLTLFRSSCPAGSNSHCPNTGTSAAVRG